MLLWTSTFQLHCEQGLDPLPRGCCFAMETSQQELDRIRTALGAEAHRAESMLELVYDQLREAAARAMRRERANHTLQATALAHDVYLRMLEQTGVTFASPDHFLAVAAIMMRRILINEARSKARLKRGGDRRRVTFSDIGQSGEVALADIDILVLDETLTRLEQLDPREHQVVECHIFGGLTFDQIANVLDVSTRTVMRDWEHARAWLHVELAGPADEDAPSA